RNRLLDGWVGACPIAPEQVKHASTEVGPADGVRRRRPRNDPDRLSSVLSRLCESAELGQTKGEPDTIVRRKRISASPKGFIDPFDRQNSKVIGSKCSHPVVFAEEGVCIHEITGGENAEFQILDASGDLQRVGRETQRL